jgi:hypothetical protein
MADVKRMPIDLVGYVAAILTTIAVVPQALTSWRTRGVIGHVQHIYRRSGDVVGLWRDSWKLADDCCSSGLSAICE